MNIDVGSDKPQIERVANEDAYGIRSPVHRQEKRPRFSRRIFSLATFEFKRLPSQQSFRENDKSDKYAP
jgi:hypothetical protein